MSNTCLLEILLMIEFGKISIGCSCPSDQLSLDLVAALTECIRFIPFFLIFHYSRPMLSRKFDVLQHVGLSRGGFDVSQSVIVPASDQLLLDKFMSKNSDISDSSMELFKKRKPSQPLILQQISESIDARVANNDNDQYGFFLEDEDHD